MSGNFVSVLKSIYENSGIPVAVTDREFCVIWKNKISGSVFCEGKSVLDIFEGNIPEPGLVKVFLNNSLCSFNVLKADDKVGNERYYIIELASSESMVKFLNTPVIRDYISYICSKIKNAAGVVANSTDEIHDSISCGIYDGEDITEKLNSIDESIMSITKEVVLPDQFYSLMDMSETNKPTLSMDREMQRIVDSVGVNLGKAVKITKNCERNIFFRMDRATFETIVAGMTDQCCCAKFYPETLVYSVSRIKDDRAELSVMSINPEKRPNNARSSAVVNAELRNIKNNLFFEYICDILCERIGAVFTKTEMPNGYLFKMEFDIIASGTPCIAMTSTDYSIGRGRFGTIPLMLADFPVQKRYAYYDIDSDTDEEKITDSAKDNEEAEDEIS